MIFLHCEMVRYFPALNFDFLAISFKIAYVYTSSRDVPMLPCLFLQLSMHLTGSEVFCKGEWNIGDGKFYRQR